MPYKGTFRPSYPEKYLGDPSNIIFRSLWERSLMKYFDTSKSVLKWSSEEIKIPYLSPKDNKIHQYYPDFVIKARMKDKTEKIIMIEVKPQKQTEPPKQPKRKSKSYLNECVTYSVNVAKWAAAQKYCEEKGWDFKLMTEKNIYGK